MAGSLANQVNIPFAKELRKVQTDAEIRMWYSLRDRRLGGYKFRRQMPAGRYIVDFCCYDKKLVVELDGSQHVESVGDKDRTAYLNKNGFKMLRFWNRQVLKETSAVCDKILNYLNRKTV